MENPVRKILCPVDFSEPSERALAQAVALARLNGAELILLTVVQPVPTSIPGEGTLLNELRPMPFIMTELAQEHLDKLRDKYCGEISGRTAVEVAAGVPFVEIVRAARDAEADLIVMGSHGRTGLEHLLIGSVAERVVRKAPCSVLVVRDAARRFVMP
jgi:nucleotide-binding universal stress UspA family protein